MAVKGLNKVNKEVKELAIVIGLLAGFGFSTILFSI